MSLLFAAVKILFQDLCKLKLDWDAYFCDKVNIKFISRMFDLMKLHYFSIDRSYFRNGRDQVASLQIHGCGNSLEISYAAIYLRIATIQGI